MKNNFTLLVIIVALLVIIAGWVTHLVWWLTLAMNQQLDTISEGVLAVLGTLVPPVGVIHGVILWF